MYRWLLSCIGDTVMQTVASSLTNLLPRLGIAILFFKTYKISQGILRDRLLTERRSVLEVLQYLSFLHRSGWRCEVCDLQENLWMNLTDGKVLCGRRYFDGSGGNNHALLHFQQTGHPLAVKLGTITPDGAGTGMVFFCLPQLLKINESLWM